MYSVRGSRRSTGRRGHCFIRRISKGRAPMPRKRDPNKPIRERAQIDTPEQINFQIKKIYQASAQQTDPGRRGKEPARYVGRDPCRDAQSGRAASGVDDADRRQHRPAAEGSNSARRRNFLCLSRMRAWCGLAYNGGPRRGRRVCRRSKPKLTKAAFESLSGCALRAPKALVQTDQPRLRLIEPEPPEETLRPDEEATIDNLRSQISEVAQKLGVPLGV